MPRLVYSSRYNMGLWGLERLAHPFDARKYGRAWRLLERSLGERLGELHLEPGRPVTDDELAQVHSARYLEALRSPETVARALEIPALRLFPGFLLRWLLLTPMRWATRGTVVAAEAAPETGLAINLGGGFHHAKPDGGEGFCLFADVGLAVAQMRAQGRLPADAPIACVDLDAHLGNGVCHVFLDDATVRCFDFYNGHIYPTHDRSAVRRLDCGVALPMGCGDRRYLELLERHLDEFLDGPGFELAFYNAGTDVYRGDPLGGLSLSADAILKRDRMVVGALRERGIPTVMVLSGGYTDESHRLVARSVAELVGDG